ncbi:membrane protein insertion efficiency factor YidD [Candidatus Megaera venefica]|uniref:membrane protein insertion efficiency factor YidD n=1 Tax=Candidatus Megaera venefica TaxID=2055910 RepID=UPI002AD46C8B|nr:membrane protein insertion efficiency factor YidD [Candidatus Megaera venefica]
MKYPLILIIKFYQYFISPWLGKNCKYSPTCSAYCLEAINSYGAIKGIFFSIKRIIRCNPFTSGGYDPLPNHKSK